MLMMEPPLSRKNEGFSFKKKITREDILAMRKDIGANFDKIQIILKQIPNYMLLVFRYSDHFITIYIVLYIWNLFIYL